MKRGSSIGAPHAVQIATGCDGQPTLPSLREALERELKYQRHIERAGRSGPRCRTWGQAAPVAERGNLKAPEVTQLNYRLTAKLHKAKVCDDRIAARAPRAATPCRAAEKLDQFSPLRVSRATVWRSLSGWPAAQSGYHGGTGQVLCFRCRRAERHRLLRMQG